MDKPLLLASSSPYRKALLDRLGLPFTTASPDIDETPLPGEPAEQLVRRLAADKASALSAAFPGHLIIGSDQAAALEDGRILGKPGSHDQARHQLTLCSGRSVCFHTGLSLLNSRTGEQQTCVESYRVRFRPLSEQTIEHYLLTEQPYDCAGSFRMEGLGIALFSGFEGRDPNSLTGLPLMALVDLLASQGVDTVKEAYLSSNRD